MQEFWIGDASFPGRGRGRTNLIGLTFDGFKGLLPSSTVKKMVKPNLVISGILLIPYGLCVGPRGDG